MNEHEYRAYGQDHHVTSREQDDEWKRANPGTPLLGTDTEDCWYCGGTGEDQRRPCPNCQQQEGNSK